MRSPTRSIAATWTRWPTSSAICSSRSCSTPGWPRKPAISRLTTSSTRISDKLERRHPHIFGDADEGGHHLWEVIKAEERAKHPDKSALAGVALALPALERAAKLQKRAARTGFDWPDIEGPKAKIRRGTGRDRRGDAERAGGRGWRPAVRRRQLRTSSQDRAGRGAAQGQSQVRAAFPRRSRQAPGFRRHEPR